MFNPTDMFWDVTPLIPLENHPQHSLLIQACQATRVEEYLEIGAHRGASLLAVMSASPDLERATIVDNWSFTVKSLDEYFRLIKGSKYFREDVELATVTGDSTEMLDKLPEYGASKGPYDLILVDGGHSYDVALSDLRKSWPLLRAGGYLVLDDLQISGVERAEREWKKDVEEGIEWQGELVKKGWKKALVFQKREKT